MFDYEYYSKMDNYLLFDLIMFYVCPLTDYFLSLDSLCPNYVRVYNSDIEKALHPAHNNVTPPNGMYERVRASYSHLSLYNLARREVSAIQQLQVTKVFMLWHFG